MRILHSSDWHIGRTFHGHPTLEALRAVLGALAEQVRERDVDVVVVAGDVFDSAAPSGESFRLLAEALRRLRAAGAVVVMTSGNHDSAARLGFQSEYAALGGVHILTDPDAVDRPVTLADAHGEVDLFGIPYLEPVLLRHRWGGAELRTQADVIGVAMARVRAARREGVRSVVLAHTFAAGGAAEASDVEREIRVGGVDAVPIAAFDGVDYAALGHIHGRAELAPAVRYSGAPLHYAFSEAGKPRGSWLVELGASGLESAEWLPLPVPRELSTIRGTLEELLARADLDGITGHWVSAVVTDRARPTDAMRRLQSRFPHCAHLAHEPEGVQEDGAASYAARVRAKSDEEIVDGFLAHVRGGEGAAPAETELIRELVDARRAGEAEA